MTGLGLRVTPPSLPRILRYARLGGYGWVIYLELPYEEDYSYLDWSEGYDVGTGETIITLYGPRDNVVCEIYVSDPEYRYRVLANTFKYGALFVLLDKDKLSELLGLA